MIVSLKKKRKNAILIKFLETQTYNWASQEDVNPFQKETFDNFLISGNHKNFKTWKKAFKLVAKDAGVEADTITETINKAKTRKASSTPQKRKGRENEVTTPSKKERVHQTHLHRKELLDTLQLEVENQVHQKRYLFPKNRLFLGPLSNQTKLY